MLWRMRSNLRPGGWASDAPMRSEQRSTAVITPVSILKSQEDFFKKFGIYHWFFHSKTKMTARNRSDQWIPGGEDKSSFHWRPIHGGICRPRVLIRVIDVCSRLTSLRSWLPILVEFESNWSTQGEIGRKASVIYRIGQRRPCIIYNLST